jgi:hypothetical protein
LFANLGNGLFHELSAGRVSTEECANDAHQKDEYELSEGENKRCWQVDEHTPLE